MGRLRLIVPAGAALGIMMLALFADGPERAMHSTDVAARPAQMWTIEGVGRLFGIGVTGTNDLWAVGSTPGKGGYRLGSGIPVAIPAEGAITHWDGTTWKLVASINVGEGAVRHELWDVAGASSDDVWAVGKYEDKNWKSSTLVAHWDGTEWKVIPSPNVGAGESELTGVAALGSNDVWAVGSASKGPLVIHWDGEQWEVVPVPESRGKLNKIVAITARDMWAVGSSGGDTLTMHWDGAVWERIASPNIRSASLSDLVGILGPGNEELGNILEGVSAVASDDVWAVGYATDNWPGNRLPFEWPIVMHWDGRTWSLITQPDSKMAYKVSDDEIAYQVQSSLHAVADRASHDVWAVGSWNGMWPVEVTVVHWDGTEWIAIPCPASGAQNLGQIRVLTDIVIAGNDVWAVGVGMAGEDEGSQSRGFVLRPGNAPCATPQPTVPPSVQTVPTPVQTVYGPVQTIPVAVPSIGHR
ncbi:MAG TPA: hypothetical protein VJ183_03280 [Chloroflexia bacterium]|nr:hypothetical protein [Chloroflexia bacterium]